VQRPLMLAMGILSLRPPPPHEMVSNEQEAGRRRWS
jgi:hypothetical protein